MSSRKRGYLKKHVALDYPISLPWPTVILAFFPETVRIQADMTRDAIPFLLGSLHRRLAASPPQKRLMARE